MSDGTPPGEAERGLPGKHGEFVIALAWPLRFALTAAIGAVLAFAVSTAFPGHRAGHGGVWLLVAAGAASATYLSRRSVHGWHVSTFVDGSVVGLIAAPLFAVVSFGTAALVSDAAFTASSVMQGLQIALYFAVFGLLVTIPCGWLAGFVYHVVLSAAERTRAKQEEEVS
ncbi:MAG: hypothetical protein U1F37_17370 [Alphaproteobacteria bacterium]